MSILFRKKGCVLEYFVKDFGVGEEFGGRWESEGGRGRRGEE